MSAPATTAAVASSRPEAGIEPRSSASRLPTPLPAPANAPRQPRNRPKLSSSTSSPRRAAPAQPPKSPETVNFDNFALARPYPNRVPRAWHRFRLNVTTSRLAIREGLEGSD